MAKEATYIDFVEGSAPANPASGRRRVYAKSDGMYERDDAGAEEGLGGGASLPAGTDPGDLLVWDGSAYDVLPVGANDEVLTADDGEALGLKYAAPTPSATVAGRQILAIATGARPGSTATAALAQDQARKLQVIVTTEMLVTGLAFTVSGTGSGTVQWGLFDCEANPAACTKLAGGSGTLGSTPVSTIAATGSPVTIAPGVYWIIYEPQGTTLASVRRDEASGATPFEQIQGSYTWDDTPDITSGWTNSTVVDAIWLVGNAS